MYGIVTYIPRSSFVAMVLLAVATTVHGGGLAFLEAKSDTATDRAVALATSANSVNVYVVGERNDSVAVYVREFVPPFGTLTFFHTVTDGVDGVDGLRSPQDIAVTADGDCVYVVSERDNAVAAFERTPFTGFLTFVEAEFDGSGGVDNMRNPSGVAVSGDSAHVYVTSPQDAVVVFARNVPDCDLDFVEFEVDAAGGVEGLNGPRGIVVSADGNNVYVAGGSSTADDDSVAVFSRDAVTGELSFVEFHQDRVAGVEGIAGGDGIAISPDDANVYVAGADANSVGVFSRNTTVGPDLGKLTFLEREKDGGGVDGLKGVRDVAIGVAGRYLYAAGRDEDAVAVFRRDVVTGQLAFLDVHKNDVDGIEGMEGPAAVAVMPDGVNVYVAARRGLQSQEGAAVSFTIDQCGNGILGVDEQCDDGGNANGDGCSSSCQLELCGSVPTAGCRTTILPGKALLKIKEGSEDKKDKLQWKWNKGEITTVADYDDPVATDDYLVCVYDSSAATQPLLALSLPAGGVCNGKPCWDPKPTKFKYKDKAATPDGIEKGQLKEGLVDGKAKMQFKGKGANLFFSLGGDVLGPSGLTLPVTVQVTNAETGIPICWESVHSIAQRNDASQFTSRGD